MHVNLNKMLLIDGAVFEILVLNRFVVRGHAVLFMVENNNLRSTNNYLHFPPFAVSDYFPFCRKRKFANSSGNDKAFFRLFNGVLNTV